ncbi:hypothetical protein E4T48_03927 [Aureobasidium sp. EXF-10727]|nr:hypothetical protein E4T48_03927 [Aureobasidium sp. EXF-10727]
MRMTRAQAAALAAAEADVDGADTTPVNDDNEHDNDNEENTSTTPTGEAQEREALSELTHNLNTNKEEEDGVVSAEHVEEVDVEKEREDESINGKADQAEEEHQGTLKPVSTHAQEAPTNLSPTATATPVVLSGTNDKPNHISIHQDDTLQPPHQDVDAGSPTTELPLLNITPQRTPAKNIIKDEFAHMRSTSNKENMVPAEAAVAGPADRLQTQVEFLGPGQHTQTLERDDQTQPENVENNHREENRGALQAEPKTPQAEDGQDDSLINHFEALSVSPKKQNFNDQEIVPGAEQSSFDQLQLSSQSIDAQKEPEKQTNKAKDDSQQSQTQDPNKDKEKHPPAPSTAKKPSSASSTADASKPARKPSVRQSTLGRQSSVVRKSMAAPSRPEPSTSNAVKRTTSVKRSSVRPSMAPRAGSSQSTERSAAPAHIPHSKPRPMSMSFPTPPPPPKSSKAPTQSTFQLPGEAIAAKLKADKEARLQRQAESGANTSRQTYKPPVTQKSTKAPTKATFQLPGEVIAAKLKQEKEERQRRAEENAPKTAYVPPVTQKSTKPVTKATFQLSSDAFAAKMKAQKEARLLKQKEEDEKREKERAVFKARPVPKSIAKPAEVRQNAASRARLPSAEIQPNGLRRATSVREPKPRPSSFHPSSSVTALPPPRPATSTSKRQSLAPSAKGKQVFARAKEEQEKEAAEKKDKEEAAKKARLEAAEKGRLASREWAARKKEKEERRRTAAAVV